MTAHRLRGAFGYQRFGVGPPPVLIAPHGDQYHAAPVLYRDLDGPAVWADSPTCGASADRWLAVGKTLAIALDRSRCERCWPPAAWFTQDTITDAETSAPETKPEPPAGPSKGKQ